MYLANMDETLQRKYMLPGARSSAGPRALTFFSCSLFRLNVEEEKSQVKAGKKWGKYVLKIGGINPSLLMPRHGQNPHKSVHYICSPLSFFTILSSLCINQSGTHDVLDARI